MESEKVKELRNKYGILDTRNEYTEEQLTEISGRKIYYVKAVFEDADAAMEIVYKSVKGYLSEDKKAAIFIKDESITGDSKAYIPFVQVERCKEIKKGIYHAKSDNIIYCTTEEIDFCLDYMKEDIKEKVKNRIEELKKQIKELENEDVKVIKL